MMPLKYMVLNTDEAADNLLAKWKPKPSEVHFLRASSNYVHILKAEGNWRFLRFSRTEERIMATLEAELEYLLYLKKHDFPAAYPLLSENGRYIEKAGDKNGEFYGLVFEKAKGKPLSAQDRTPEQYRAWGRELGRLHNLSRQYTPRIRRRTYLDYLSDFRASFTRWAEPDALTELDFVQAAMGRMKQDEDNFGLVHYDFQYDNTFWNEEEQTFYAIDFDDAHYHFYVMDIVYALEDLDDGGPENPQECIKAFYSGYKSVSALDEEILADRDVFERYSGLMHFWRTARSLEDSDFDRDPEWLAELRPRLVQKCNQFREGFKNNARFK